MIGGMIRWLSIIAVAYAGLLTAPASADSDDLAKMLFGVAATGIIAHEISKQNEAKEAATAEAAKEAATVKAAKDATSCDNPIWNGKQWVNRNGKPCPGKSSAATVKRTPAVCLRERWQNNLFIKYFDRDCMRSAGFSLSFSR